MMHMSKPGSFSQLPHVVRGQRWRYVSSYSTGVGDLWQPGDVGEVIAVTEICSYPDSYLVVRFQNERSGLTDLADRGWKFDRHGHSFWKLLVR